MSSSSSSSSYVRASGLALMQADKRREKGTASLRGGRAAAHGLTSQKPAQDESVIPARSDQVEVEAIARSRAGRGVLAFHNLGLSDRLLVPRGEEFTRRDVVIPSSVALYITP